MIATNIKPSFKTNKARLKAPFVIEVDAIPTDFVAATRTIGLMLKTKRNTPMV